MASAIHRSAKRRMVPTRADPDAVKTTCVSFYQPCAASVASVACFPLVDAPGSSDGTRFSPKGLV
ncbi:MAG: hypothetical protein J7460_14740 [Chloroflexus sp.]|nr:hypothetical protein [Chloroflexus sp.]